MADQWYYTQQGQRQGPVAEEQFKSLAAAGKLKPTDKVWKQGMASWGPATGVEGLFPFRVSGEPPPLPTDPLLTDEQWLRIARRLAMSDRELQIVRLVFEDEQEKVIATRLAISLNTVHTHLKHLYCKLGVKSRVGLVLRVVRECRADAEQDQAVLPMIMLPPRTRKAA
jgi:DNA-binding CsgD family transcriptional regulator